LFRSALAIAAIELVVHWQMHNTNHLLIVLTFVCLVMAALAEVLAKYHLFGILVRQYDWMQNLFTTAAKKLESLIATKNIPRSQALMTWAWRLLTRTPTDWRSAGASVWCFRSNLASVLSGPSRSQPAQVISKALV
jgi:hypothetical protein